MLKGKNSGKSYRFAHLCKNFKIRQNERQKKEERRTDFSFDYPSEILHFVNTILKISVLASKRKWKSKTFTLRKYFLLWCMLKNEEINPTIWLYSQENFPRLSKALSFYFHYYTSHSWCSFSEENSVFLFRIIFLYLFKIFFFQNEKPKWRKFIIENVSQVCRILFLKILKKKKWGISRWD